MQLIQNFRHNFTFRLLFIIFCIVGTGFIAMEFSLKAFISNQLLQEKQTMLFGLTHQLDNALKGTFDDILRSNRAQYDTRQNQIIILNRELSEVTDFVASGVEGVGVGYYSRQLDAIITYGPEKIFRYTIGQPIFEGHKGYEVMNSGQPLVQKGDLVRGSILNCMSPIVRNGETIGYIWANETLQDISRQMTKINNQMLFLLMLTFLVVYLSVVFTTQRFVGQVDIIKDGIQKILKDPKHRLPHLHGELNIVVSKVNELSDSVSFFKSYNRYVLNSVINGVMAMTESEQIALVNPAFRQMFLLGDQDLTGLRCGTLFDESMMALLNSVKIHQNNTAPRTFTFNERLFEVYGNGILSDNSNKMGTVFVFRDITLVRQYENELKERERMVALGEMGLNLAHEIKNPLTSIKGFTQLMQKRKISEEQKQYYLGLMHEELERVNTLLNDMLTYGGRIKLHPETVDFTELLEELSIIYKITYPDIEVHLKLTDKKLPLMTMDRSKIIQLIDNLVKNSADALQQEVQTQEDRKKYIEIELIYRDDVVQLIIRDNGPGVPEEIKEKIFTPFFTTKEHGTGFGLSLCSEIASIHKGELTALSLFKEKTEFMLKLTPSLMEKLNDL